ncbi:hypothetical protein T01_996 [Trichinella spiralis]|uniref:Secreted protein n=1 Tax=Trichinella spiralis TaxID=6334 RepID=A0A0V1AT64_TRISP|nr:hypothetical protein T01_10332 [Trichinella spiralis]KRY27975.1 hypothetical protein T01_996 [Trichinella spiralis]
METLLISKKIILFVFATLSAFLSEFQSKVEINLSVVVVRRDECELCSVHYRTNLLIVRLELVLNVLHLRPKIPSHHSKQKQI